MRPIPLKLRKEIEADPYYKHCCITGMPKSVIKLEWHHNFKFANRQINEKWCILPVSHDIHKNIDKSTQEMLDHRMLNRATDEELKKYSKAEDLIKKRDRLNKKYSEYETNNKN